MVTPRLLIAFLLCTSACGRINYDARVFVSRDATVDPSMDAAADTAIDAARVDTSESGFDSIGEANDGSVPVDAALPFDAAGPEASMPDGTMPDGAMPDGAMPDGALPDGTLPDGTFPDGTADAAADGGSLDAASVGSWRIVLPSVSDVTSTPSGICVVGQFTGVLSLPPLTLSRPNQEGYLACFDHNGTPTLLIAVTHAGGGSSTLSSIAGRLADEVVVIGLVTAPGMFGSFSIGAAMRQPFWARVGTDGVVRDAQTITTAEQYSPRDIVASSTGDFALAISASMMPGLVQIPGAPPTMESHAIARMRSGGGVELVDSFGFGGMVFDGDALVIFGHQPLDLGTFDFGGGVRATFGTWLAWYGPGPTYRRDHTSMSGTISIRDFATTGGEYTAALQGYGLPATTESFAGQSISRAANQTVCAVFRVSPGWTTTWAHTLRCANLDCAGYDAIAVDASGGVIVSGFHTDAFTFAGTPVPAAIGVVDAILLGFAADGREAWILRYSSSAWDYARRMIIDALGRVVTVVTPVFGAGRYGTTDVPSGSALVDVFPPP